MCVNMAPRSNVTVTANQQLGPRWPNLRNIWLYFQWRRKTIKSGSAFKGQFYFQGRSRGATYGSAEEVGHREVGRRSLFPLGDLGAIPYKKFAKINF